MSNRQTFTPFRNWEGPFFPDVLAAFQSHYASWAGEDPTPPQRLLLSAARLVKDASPGFVFRNPCTERTEDGYCWTRGVVFLVQRHGITVGQVLFLFPHCEDVTLRDGTKTDRSIAMYCFGEVSEQEIEALAEVFSARFCLTLDVASAWNAR